MLVQRWDKKTEFVGASENLSVETFIYVAEKGIKTHSWGKDSVIFVATDDCSAVGELRAIVRNGDLFLSATVPRRVTLDLY